MKCILCGENKYKTRFMVDVYPIVECASCGLIKTGIGVSQSYDHYHRDTDYTAFSSHFKNIFTTRYRIVSSHHPLPGTVLDIGASTGTMLDIFKEHGYKTWGVEPSTSAAFAKKKGHTIVQSYFEDAKLPLGAFDVIVMNHTLEHVKNPLLVLKKAKTLLRDGGLLLIDVPNIGSMRATSMNARWPYILPAEHTYHFTPDTLTKLFEKAGISVIHSESRSGIFECDNIPAEIWDAFSHGKKRIVKALVNLPYDLVATLLNRGDSMSIVGVKK